jgi:hypothetical protein
MINQEKKDWEEKRESLGFNHLLPKAPKNYIQKIRGSKKKKIDGHH